MDNNKALIAQFKKVLDMLDNDETNYQFKWEITLSKDRDRMTLKWDPAKASRWGDLGEV